MGQGIVVGCGNCGREVTYALGIGMAYSSLEAVIDAEVHWRQRAKIREILKTAEPDTEDYERRLYACPKCETLYSRFYISLRRNNARLYESMFRCPKCRVSLVPAEEDISLYRCQNCGKQTLECVGHLMWD